MPFEEPGVNYGGYGPFGILSKNKYVVYTYI